MNAASPAIQTFSESHSLYPTTPGGEMAPTQRAALCHALHRRRIFPAIALSFLNNPPAAVGPLPFQRIASQHLVRGPLPHKAPKLFLAFGSFASLNESRHSLQLIPGPGWLTISILS